jgi:hypothetical protein
LIGRGWFGLALGDFFLAVNVTGRGAGQLAWTALQMYRARNEVPHVTPYGLRLPWPAPSLPDGAPPAAERERLWHGSFTAPDRTSAWVAPGFITPPLSRVEKERA